MRLGVDVSEHQAGFDFDAPYLDFAILRTTDGTYQDHAFAEHASRAARLELAVYHFLRAPSEGTTAEAQVDASLSVLDGPRWPMWIDVESPAGLSLHDVSTCAALFHSAGIEVAGVYTNAWYWRRHIRSGPGGLLMADPRQFGDLWLAHWGDNPVVDLGADTAASDLPNSVDWPQPLGFPRPAVWQFTSHGRAGEAEVDLNLAP